MSAMRDVDTPDRVRLDTLTQRFDALRGALSTLSDRVTDLHDRITDEQRARRALEETCRVYDARLADMQVAIEHVQRRCSSGQFCALCDARIVAGISTLPCGASAESTGSAASSAASPPGG
jgi:hypothetical protein